MFVKICANKTIKDAKACIDAGADLIGLLIGQNHSSNDFISKETGKEICDYAINKINVCVVTHYESAEDIIKICEFVGNNYLQLHSNIGDLEVEKIKKVFPNIKIIRLIHISSDGKILSDLNNIKIGDYYLLDSFNKSTNQVGGTGLTHNWQTSKKLVKSLNKPIILAGGLNPLNVKSAIEIVEPFGVDVNSGCKTNGVKDYKKIKDFVKNAKNNN